MANLIPSILTSIKKDLNIPENVEAFDPDILMHINMAFAKLNQLGVGPDEVFMIDDASAVWSDFSTDAITNMARTYVYLEVRLVFDPPTASLLTSLEKKRDELEWRLSVAQDKLLYANSEEDQNESE